VRQRLGGTREITDGYWGAKEMKLFSPAEARDVQMDAASLTVFLAPCKSIRHRLDTLTIPQLTLSFQLPATGRFIRVHVCHFKGGLRAQARLRAQPGPPGFSPGSKGPLGQ